MLVCQIYVSVFVIYVDMYVRCSFVISVCWLSSVDFSVPYVDWSDVHLSDLYVDLSDVDPSDIHLWDLYVDWSDVGPSDLYVDLSNVNFFRTGLLKTLVSVNHWLNLLTGAYLLTDGQILLLES